MIELRVLGEPSVAERGRVLASIVAKPKLFGLLTYLTCHETSVFHQRDTLLAMFWPESDLERARNCLRQTLHRLRLVLGPGRLIQRGRALVGIQPGEIACDAHLFLEDCKAGRQEDAMARYDGDFLEGFHVRRAPGFERWADQRRVVLRQRAVRLAIDLAGQADLRADSPGAVRWWYRAERLAPWDERVIRGLVTSLVRGGRSGTAVRRYTQFVDRLWSELQLRPSENTRRAVEQALYGKPAGTFA